MCHDVARNVRFVSSMPLTALDSSHPIFKSAIGPLWVYVNGHAFGDVTAPRRRRSLLQLINLSSAQPWADTFRVGQASKHSCVQLRYRYGLWKCIAPWWSGHICSDVLTAYKVAALADAYCRFVCDDIVWLDADAFLVRPDVSPMLEWMRSFDVVTIGRKHYYPETGVLFLNGRSAQARELVVSVVSLYREISSLSERDAKGCTAAKDGINDVQAFAQGFAADPAIRVGWLAVGCPSNGTIQRRISQYQVPLGSNDVYCPAENAQVSPFHAFKYVVHEKNQRGLVHQQDASLINKAPH